MSFVIIPDSSADTASWAPEMTFAPMVINAGDFQFVDDAEGNPNKMMEFLADYKGKSGSACPGIGDWLIALGEAREAFLITITSGLSGSYNSACTAARQAAEHDGKLVHVIDSLATGGEMRILIEKLQELRESGHTFAEAKEKIQAYHEHLHTLFALESLNNLANNGRVSPMVAKAAGLLGIRAIGKASEIGELEMLTKCRGEKKTLAAVFKIMQEHGYKGGKVRINHADNEAAAKGLAAIIREHFPNADVVHYTARCLNSFYAERGGFILGFEGE